MKARTEWLSAVLVLIVSAATACATNRDSVPSGNPEPSLVVSIEVDGGLEAQTTEPNTDPRTVAVAFADVWGRSDLSDDAWAAAIRPLCSPRYGTLLLAYPRSAGAPASRTTDAIEIRREPGLRVYSVGTEVGTMLITVVAVDSSWKVDSAQPPPSGDEASTEPPQPKPAP